jgi:hypothetical protein
MKPEFFLNPIKTRYLQHFFTAFFCVSFLASAAFTQTRMSDAALSRQFVGVWQDAPHVASGMSDLYRFYKTGRFVFEYNTMNWSKRTISYSGKWKIVKGKLILSIEERTDVVGGKKVKVDEASGSGDEYEIEGGKAVTRKLRPAVVETRQLGKLMQGELVPEIRIRKLKFWRLANDPDAYRN